MTLKFPCPYCGQRISADKSQFGQSGRCPTCNTSIIIPELLKQPPPTPSEDTSNSARKILRPSSGNSGCGSGCSDILGTLLVILLVVIGIQKCSSDKEPTEATVTASLEVSESDYGDRWPLTVSSGTLQRRNLNGGLSDITFKAPDGTMYGLNGTALSHGHRDIRAITKIEKVYDADVRSYYDVSVLIRAALNAK